MKTFKSLSTKNFNRNAVLIAILLIMGACKSDNNSIPEEVIEDLKDTLVSSVDNNISQSGNQSSRNQDEEKADSIYEANVKKNIGGSDFTGSIKQKEQKVEIDCEEILKRCEQELKKSIKLGEYTDLLIKADNDLLFIKCQNDERYKKRFKDLQDRINTAFD